MTLPQDVSAIATDNGGFDLVKHISAEGASLGVAYGTIEAPWATDANGKALRTTYALQGSELTQTIDVTADTTFPVVADPKYSWGWVSGTTHYNRSETRSMKTISFAAASAAAICAVFGAETFGAACAISAAMYGQWVYVAGNAYGDGKCVKIRIPPFWAYAYKDSYCK